jgi:hypothetical protein
MYTGNARYRESTQVSGVASCAALDDEMPICTKQQMDHTDLSGDHGGGSSVKLYCLCAVKCCYSHKLSLFSFTSNLFKLDL